MHPAERADTANPVRARTEFGDFELTILSDGTYFLDGGAMFGVVPKPLWEKRAPADAKNRILLGLNTVVVRTGKHNVVIETGIGNKLSDKLREIHEAKQQLPRAFEVACIRPEEISTIADGIRRAHPKAASFPLSPMPAILRTAARLSTGTCNSNATPSAIPAKTTTRWSRAGR